MAKRLDLQHQANEAIRVAGLAVRHFAVWRVYSEPSSRQRLFPSLSQFGEFVKLDEKAHLEMCLLHAATLFEDDDRTINLASLIEEAGAASDQFMIEEARQRLSEGAAIIGKLRFLRNNAIAHRSARLSRAEVFERQAMTADELQTVINDAEQIAWAVGMAFGVRPYQLAAPAADELRALFSLGLPTQP